MSSTNKTTNLELSQFLGSDSPKWLTDYNADMQKIDTAVGAVQSQADATDLVVSGHSTAIESLQTTEGEQGTAITELRTDVNHNSGDISTINSLIGNGEPTTTDKTIIGAINELHGDITNAKKITHFVAEHVIAEVTADGVKTNSALLDELFAGVSSFISTIPQDELYLNLRIATPNRPQMIYSGSYINFASVLSNMHFGVPYIDGGGNAIVTAMIIKSSGSVEISNVLMSNTVTTYDNSTDVPASGAKFIIFGNKYKYQDTII